MKGLARMFNSSKTWTVIFDGIVVLVVYFCTKYLAPSALEDVMVILAFVQVLVGLVIVGIFVEDAAEKRAAPWFDDTSYADNAGADFQGGYTEGVAAAKRNTVSAGRRTKGPR